MVTISYHRNLRVAARNENEYILYCDNNVFFLLQCVKEKIATVSETFEAITLTSKWFYDNVWSM